MTEISARLQLQLVGVKHTLIVVIWLHEANATLQNLRYWILLLWKHVRPLFWLIVSYYTQYVTLNAMYTYFSSVSYRHKAIWIISVFMIPVIKIIFFVCCQCIILLGILLLVVHKKTPHDRTH